MLTISIYPPFAKSQRIGNMSVFNNASHKEHQKTRAPRCCAAAALLTGSAVRPRCRTALRCLRHRAADTALQRALQSSLARACERVRYKIESVDEYNKVIGVGLDKYTIPLWLRCEGATTHERQASAFGAHLCRKGCAWYVEMHGRASLHTRPGETA